MPADALDLAIANADAKAINFSPMDIFAKGAKDAQQISLQNAFAGGVPMSADGVTPDYGKMANKLYQLGDVNSGNTLANLGLQRQLFNSAIGTLQPQQGQGAQGQAPQVQPNSYAAATYGAESGNNPNAKNPNSTAGGLAQFTDPTWADLAQRHPELKLTQGGQYDPQQVARALPVFTQENAGVLQGAGIQPTDANLRVAHLLGAQGATGFLTSMAQNPNAPAASMVGPAAVKANQSLFFGQGGQPVSAQQFYANVTQGFSPGVSGQPSPGMGQQQGSAQPLIMGQYTPQQAQQQAQALFQKGTALNLVKPGAGSAMVDQAKALMEAAAKTFAPSRNVSDYMVGHQPGESMSDYQARTAGQTETAKKFAEITGDQYKEAGKNYQAAQATLYRLGIIDHSIDALGPNWMGAGANLKAGVAKSWNSVAQLLPDGIASKFQIDPNKVATWEDINKQTTNLGFELAKTLGSREAQMIVQQSISSVPGAQQTYLGSKLVSASLRQAAQRQQDYYEYLGQHPGQVGADIAFNRQHPVEQYVTNAVKSIGGQQGAQPGQQQAQAPKMPPAGSVVVQNGVRFQIQPDGSAKALQ